MTVCSSLQVTAVRTAGVWLTVPNPTRVVEKAFVSLNATLTGLPITCIESKKEQAEGEDSGSTTGPIGVLAFGTGGLRGGGSGDVFRDPAGAAKRASPPCVGYIVRM